MKEYYLDRIRDGSTLSGEIRFLLQPDGAAQTNGMLSQADSISFLVDGEALGKFYPPGCLGISTNNLSEGIILAIDLRTYGFSNGYHTIAAARLVAEKIVERQVVFENVISKVCYDPIFDLTPGAEDIEDKAHITAVLSPPQHWEVRITDMEDEIVKSFSGAGTLIDIFWDGTDANGEVVEDESYDLAITAVESNVSIWAGCINKNSL